MGLLDSYGDQLPDLLPDVGQNQQQAPAPAAAPRPERPLFKSALRITQDLQPDQFAEDIRLGKQVGLPPDFVAADRAMTRQKALEDDAEKLFAGAPIAKNFLGQNPSTLALTKDDLPNVAGLENILTRNTWTPAPVEPKEEIALDGTPYLDYSNVPVNQLSGLPWLSRAAQYGVEMGLNDVQRSYIAFKHWQAGTDFRQDPAYKALLRSRREEITYDNGALFSSDWFKNLAERAWVGAFKVAPMLGSSAVEGGKTAAIAGAAYAPAAAATAATGVGAPVSGISTAGVLAAGWGAGFTTDMFKQFTGSSYEDKLTKGFTPEESRYPSLGAGLLNTALMQARLPASWFAKLPIIAPVVEKYGAGRMLSEVLSKPSVLTAMKEAGAEFGKESVKNAALGTSMAAVSQLSDAAAEGVKAGDTPQDMIARMADAASQPKFWTNAIQGGWDMTVDMAGLAALPASRMLARDMVAAERSKADADFFKALDDNVAASKLRERLPEAHAELVDAIREQTGGVTPENVYVDAARLREATGLQGDTFYQLLSQIGVDPEEFNRSEALKTDVAVPLKGYASKVAGTDLSAKLREDIKLDPDGMSSRQAKEFEQKRDELVQQVQAEQEKSKAQADADFEAAKQEKLAQFLNGAVFEGGVKPTREDAAAQLAPMFDMAQRSSARWAEQGVNITPAEILRKVPVEWVEPGAQAGGGLRQNSLRELRGGVHFEVAPDPHDKALTDEWNGLPQADKARVSTEVAQKIVPQVLSEVGAAGKMETQLGGYEGATNPSLVLTLDKPAKLVETAKLLGHALAQDSMMVASSRRAPGTKLTGAVSITLPEGYGPKEVEALYNKLWELEHEGKKLVEGHTTADGQMVILNSSTLDIKAFGDRISAHLGEGFEVIGDKVYSAFIGKKEYGYGVQDERRPDAGQPSAQERADRLRSEATRLVREALDQRRGTVRKQPAAVRAGGPQSIRAGSYEVARRYGTARDGSESVLGFHFSGAPRETLDTFHYGSGIKGEEAKRLAYATDERLKRRLHFYIDSGSGITPEPGVGSALHGIHLDNMYNIEADPLGIRREVLSRGLPRDEVANAVESAILDAGYDGYFAMHAQGDQGVGVLLGPQHKAVPAQQFDIRPSERSAPAPAEDTRPRVSARAVGDKTIYTDMATGRTVGSVGPDGKIELWPGREGQGFEQAIQQDLAARNAKTLNQPVFYSQLERTLEAKLSNGTAAQHLKTLAAWAKKGEFKSEELEWSGLKEWLEAKGDEKVSKQEVLDFLRQGGVKVEEVVKGSSGEHVTQAMIDAAEAAGNWDEYDRLTRIYEDQELGSNANNTGNETKFAQYQLPGGENYRELLLALPDQNKARADRLSDEFNVLVDKYGPVPQMPPEARARAEKVSREHGAVTQAQYAAQNFSSSHFSEPNILAHVRFNERTDVGGKRVLFLEEIQSDWAQKGRKEGFGVEDLSAEIEALQRKYDALDAEIQRGDLQGRTIEAMRAERKALDIRITGMRRRATIIIPDAPFVKNTGAWSMLAMKRMIRWAAENGFDKIAWTTGEQQAEWYDLSKQVSKIALDEAGTLQVQDLNGKMVLTEKNVTKERAADIVGKGVADKLFAQDAKKTNLTEEGFGYPGGKDRQGVMLSGLDLKVGGEGMKGFYDKILPNETNKLIKKWGGKVVGTTLGNILEVAESTDPGDAQPWHVVSGADTRAATRGEPLAKFATKAEAAAYAKRNGVLVHSFDITPQMREGALAGQALFQERNSGVRGSITLDTNGAFIRLVKGSANLSTMLHETAHLFVNDLENMVATGKAPEQVVKDLETLRVFAGDMASVKGQEKLARAFEAYLREGKAPKVELEGAFARFRAWLTAIYRDVKAQLGVDMNPEIRGVFDRMLAADDEIKDAENSYSSGKAMSGIEGGLLTPAEQKRIADLRAQSHSDAVEKRTQRYVKAYFKALGGRAEFEKQARAEVDELPIYKSVSSIVEDGGLPVSALDEAFGQKARQDLALRFPGLVDLKGGSIFGKHDLETLAIAHGFDSADDMAVKLLGTSSRGDAVKQLADQKMAAEEARLREALSGEAVPAIEDLHNDATLARIALEAKALERKIAMDQQAKQAVSVPFNAHAARDVARDIIAGATVGQAGRYDRYAAAERRAGIEADRLIKAEKWQEAMDAKRREAINHALVIESVKAREQAAKQVKSIIREARAKSIDFAAREQILALTEAYGIGPKGLKPMKPEELTSIPDYFRSVYGEDELGMSPVDFFNSWALGRENPGSYKNLTVNQMNEVHALVSALADAGGSEFARMATEQGTTRQQQVEKMVSAIQNSGHQTTMYDKGTRKQRASSAFRGIMASLQKMPDLFRNADGNVDATARTAHIMGPNQEFGERVHAGVRKALEILYGHKDLKDIEAAKIEFAKRFKDQFGERVAEVNGVQVPPGRKLEGMQTWTAESVWCVALNMGNEGNLRTLLQGDGLTMDELVKLTSLLNETEWKAVQATWDMLGGHYAETDKVFRQVYGFPMPNRVKAHELTVRTAEGKDLTLPGGYFPIKVDRDINPDIGAKQDQDLIKGDPSNKFAATIARGHTIERQGTSRPVSLSYEVAHRALLDQARFISLAPVIKDAQAIFNNKDYRRAMIDAFGREAYEEIMPWLKNIASPVIERRDAFDNTLSKMRHLSTLYILGLNLRSAMKQYLGLAGTASKLGVRWTASGMAELAKWGGMGVDFVNERSAFMRNRNEGLNPELAEINAKARGKDFRLFGINTGLPKKKAVDAVMILTRLTDRHVTYGTWLGAYKKGLQELGMNDSAAVDFADRLVRRTQMSGSSVDTTSWQRNEGAARLLTMFMSEAIPKSSRMRSDFMAYRQGRMSTAQYARSLFYESIAPAVGYTALIGLMGGEDQKSWWKDLFWNVYSETFGLFPLLGGLQSAVEWGKPVASTPALDALDVVTNMGKAAVKLRNDHSSEGKARLYKAVVDAMAYFHGVGNLRRLYETAAEGWKDIDHNKTVNPFRIFIKKPKD